MIKNEQQIFRSTSMNTQIRKKKQKKTINILTNTLADKINIKHKNMKEEIV